MPTSIRIIWGIAALATALSGCAERPADGDVRKPLPISRIQYRLEVDPHSLPAGVYARERRVPGNGRVQTWIRNESEVPFVIESVSRPRAGNEVCGCQRALE